MAIKFFVLVWFFFLPYMKSSIACAVRAGEAVSPLSFGLKYKLTSWFCLKSLTEGVVSFFEVCLVFWLYITSTFVGFYFLFH